MKARSRQPEPGRGGRCRAASQWHLDLAQSVPGPCASAWACANPSTFPFLGRAQAQPSSESESECRPCGSSIPGGRSPRGTVSLRPRSPKEGAMCALAGHSLFPRLDQHSIGGGARRCRQRFPSRSRVAASSRSAPYGRVRRAGSLCAGGAGPRTGRQNPAQPPRQRRAAVPQPCPVSWPAGRGSLSRPQRPRPNPLWRPANGLGLSILISRSMTRPCHTTHPPAAQPVPILR